MNVIPQVHGIACLLPARWSVVVGQGDGAQPVGVRLPHHLLRRFRAIGVVRMQVQVAGPCRAAACIVML